MNRRRVGTRGCALHSANSGGRSKDGNVIKGIKDDRRVRRRQRGGRTRWHGTKMDINAELWITMFGSRHHSAVSPAVSASPGMGIKVSRGQEAPSKSRAFEKTC